MWAPTLVHPYCLQYSNLSLDLKHFYHYIDYFAKKVRQNKIKINSNSKNFKNVVFQLRWNFWKLKFRKKGLDTQRVLLKFCFFQLYFSKKYVEVAINDFAMYLFWNKLDEKMLTEEKNNETKRYQNERRNCLPKCLYLFQ